MGMSHKIGSCCEVLLRVLHAPDSAATLELKDWDLLLRQARRASLLSRLAMVFGGEAMMEAIPFRPAQHLVSARMIAMAQKRAVKWEVEQICRALNGAGIPIVLLKGAAYVCADLPAGQGRIFNDIDVLVPRGMLENVEKVLRFNGWASTVEDEYDQRYYRQWMHELPPMRHVKRKTVIDVHHTILPETARLHPDPEKLLAGMQLVPGYDNVYTLSNIDMILHSATHLFHDGELENGLRDLVDLDALLRHFSKDEGFWDQLVERAVEMDLARPLYYALRYTQQMLQTPVPGVAMMAAAAIGRPPAPLAWLMDVLFAHALMPDHPSCDDALTPLARWMLYIRSHYLRMPFHLLIPHLVRKAIKKRFSPAPLDEPKLEDN